MHKNQIIRFSELKSKIGASRSSIFRWERDGHFPKRRQLGSHSVGWLLQEIDDWITTRSTVNAAGRMSDDR